jgi:hypothetical protein
MIIDISRLLLSKQDSGRAIASGIRYQCRTAPTGLRRTRRRFIVSQAFLHTLGIALGFNIDSRSRQAQLYLTSTPNNSYGNLAKTIKTIN